MTITHKNHTKFGNYFIVIDFGSQYTQLLARRVRELNCYCQVIPASNRERPSDDVIDDLKGIILSGGPHSVFSENAPKMADWVLELNEQKKIPILGICYGMQILNHQFKGKVVSADFHEYGYSEARARGHSKLLENIQDRKNELGHGLLDVWMSHGDSVQTLAKGFKCIASTNNCPIAGIADEEAKIYALQFHPEVTQTSQGKEILKRFVQTICCAKGSWTTDHIIQTIIKDIQTQIGSNKVMLGLSGGVDSSVSAVLLQQAIGDQLTCVFIDNGLLRHQEGQKVKQLFQENFGVKLIAVDAKKQFMSALQGIDDPEQKRKKIGESFINIFEEQSIKLQGVKWLAQGTIYSDIIESAGNGGHTKVIKSHHNVGGLPETMNLKIIEPLKFLFKDEVRKIGEHLGIPSSFINRHPFPGPGLGVRLLGEIKPELITILRLADAIFMHELELSNNYHKVSQAFAVLLPVKSVGVVGDNRRYGWTIALRAVNTIDFMTAEWAELPYSLLGKVSSRIINEIPTVSRVVYDISGKPPATIEWE